MNPTVLLVATATRWLGPARMPRDLALAGWDVALLAPRGALARHSRYLKRIVDLPERATPLQWVHAFAGAVAASAPRLVLPCDDTAVRLLHRLAATPPDDMQPTLHLRLAALIAASIGAPVHYRASVDKTLVCAAAEAAGVPVPPYAVVASVAEASAFAAAHGWPVVLKRSHSSAGDGVAICADPAALAREFPRLRAGARHELDDADEGRLLVQAFIAGPIRYYAGTFWRGALLCGYAVDKVAGDPQGPASVVRYFHSPALEDSARRLGAAFGATGVFAPEYVVDARSGDEYLLEINRRMTPGTHRGRFIDVSTGAALYAAAEGTPARTRARLDDEEEHVFVNFPHEWLRDPESRHLRERPVDVPWDEPRLIAAMLASRHES
jgi:glutathione synthase/RimK-type ligase-like ATP-grasp enzyme